MSSNFPNRFQEAINTPVDIEAEIKAYEEEQARKSGEEPQDQEPDVEDGPDPEGHSDSVSEPGSKPDEDGAIETKKHPGGAWQTMRAKVKAAEEEVRQVREEMARREGEQRAWQTYQQQLQQQQQALPQEERIDPTIDPIGAVQRLEQQTQQMREYIQQQQLIGEVQKAYKADAQRFMASKPDFQQAYEHAVNARARQLQIAGATPQQAWDQTHREEMELAYTALQQGRSPAQVIYEMAGAYGYSGTNLPESQVQPRDAQGKFVSIEQQAKKNAAATSISPGGTPPKDGGISMEDALKNPGLFDKWYEQEKAAAKSKGKISW